MGSQLRRVENSQKSWRERLRHLQKNYEKVCYSTKRIRSKLDHERRG
jgi:hypothetical protein